MGNEAIAKLGEKTRFTSERQPEKRGRTKGSKNRGTIAKMILALPASFIQADNTAISLLDPDTGETLTIDIETAITLKQAEKAYKSGDTNAFNALMDNAYGKASKEVQAPEDAPVTIDYSRLSDSDLAVLKTIQRKAMGLDPDGSQPNRPDTTEAEIIP